MQGGDGGWEDPVAEEEVGVGMGEGAGWRSEGDRSDINPIRVWPTLESTYLNHTRKEKPWMMGNCRGNINKDQKKEVYG